MRRALRAGPWLGWLGALLLVLAGCSSRAPDDVGIYKLGRPYQIGGRWYYPSYDPSYDRVGVASWYGSEFHGRPTANGERFDRHRVTAAHPTLPLPSIVRVTNLANRRSLELRVNDRGPFIGDRIIDLSQAAARELGYEGNGLTPVRVQFVRLADARGQPPRPPPPRSAPKPAPVAPPHATTVVATAHAAPSCSLPGHYVQVAAFAEPGRAARLARELQATVPAPVRTEPPLADGLARVRLGPLGDRGAVASTLHQLKRLGYPQAFPVTEETSAWRAC